MSASSPPDTGNHRSERADSRRKRLRLIEAARAVVAEKGLDAGAAEIAARAEVGVGTLYRRFGSLEALVEDIVLDGIAEVQAAADRSLADADPWSGLTSFLYAHSKANSANRGLFEFTAQDASTLSPQLLRSTLELRAAIKEITRRAHEAGVLREDVAWGDLVVLSLSAVHSGTCLGLRADGDQWQRVTSLLIEALRAPGRNPLPSAPPVDLLESTDA